jgi:prepilin-type N-terminal cleavage/methylation domain-containing protein
MTRAIARLRFRSGGDRHDQRGMSLIEVLIVVAILGMMALIGTPAMEIWLERYRARTAAQEIATSIQLQRMRAVSRNRDHSIQFDERSRAYELFEGDPDTGTPLTPEPITLPEGVSFGVASGDPIEFASDLLTFHPDGSINTRNAVVESLFLENNLGDSFEVTVNLTTGRVEVIKDLN